MTSLQPTYPALPFIYRNSGNALDPKPTPSANVSSSEITLSIPDQLQQQLQTYGYPQNGPYSIQQKHQHIKQPSYQDHQTRQQSPTQQIMSTIPPQIPDNVLRKPNIPGTEQPDVDWNNPENYNSQPNTDSKRPGGLVLPNRHYSLPQSNVGTAYINSGQVPGSTLSSTSYPSSARGYPVGSASTGFGYDINKPSYYYDSNSVHQQQAQTQQQYYSYHAPPADSDSYLVPQPIVNGLPQQQQQVVQEQNTTQHNVNQSPKTFQGYNDYKYNIYQGSNGGNAYGAYYPDMPDRTRVANSLLYNLTGEANSAHYAQPAEYEAAPPNNSVMFNTHYAISMQYPNQEYLHHLPHQKEPQSPKRFRPRKSIEGKQMPMSRASNSVSLLVQEWFVIEPTIEQREKMFSNKWRLGTTETSYFNKRKRAIGVIHNVEKQFPNLNKFQIAKYIDDYLKVKKFKYPQFISHIQTVVQRQQCEREILEYIRNELDKA
ncbi:uncharacterized protein KQ657_002318 [Scheffersomyces spartinae]|uniref:Transcription activator GCR1-like domain-containing protein n=1 Tax=Scheffersomyces spartinae TaxID=45513 RepID=A0A9P8AKI1_9ASCO|nr:uncharacterized protein KQ657_002318 [Scheffersomyces spartinae]KAG7195932.1 hypothetical protein KQ657_002318 [Scheffersomyces spartinae]